MEDADKWNAEYRGRMVVAVKNFQKFKNNPDYLNAELAEFLNDPIRLREDGKGYTRNLIIDVSKPEIRMWIDRLSGPNSYAFFKLLEIQKNADH